MYSCFIIMGTHALSLFALCANETVIIIVNGHSSSFSLSEFLVLSVCFYDLCRTVI